MSITEITVGAGTSFNHPHEQYANFKPSVTIKATVAPGADGAAIARELQRRAHQLIVEEKERILDEIDRDQEIENLQREIGYKESSHKERLEMAGKFEAKATELAAELQMPAPADDTGRFARYQEHMKDAKEGAELCRRQAQDNLTELNELRAKLDELLGLPPGSGGVPPKQVIADPTAIEGEHGPGA